MYNKIKFLCFSFLVLSVLSAEPSKEDKLKGLDVEISTSSHQYKDAKISGEFNGIRAAFIGDYKENSQLYFSTAYHVMLRKDKNKEDWIWDTDYLNVSIGLFHRSNFGNDHMFLDLGILGEQMGSFGNLQSTYLTPEIGMGVKLPIFKKSKLIIRVALGYRIFDTKSTDKSYYIYEEEEEEEEEERDDGDDEDWEDWKYLDSYYPNKVVLRIDIGIGS